MKLWVLIPKPGKARWGISEAKLRWFWDSSYCLFFDTRRIWFNISHIHQSPDGVLEDPGAGREVAWWQSRGGCPFPKVIVQGIFLDLFFSPFRCHISELLKKKKKMLISFLYFSSPWSSISFLKPLTQWLEECSLHPAPSCLCVQLLWLPLHSPPHHAHAIRCFNMLSFASLFILHMRVACWLR